MECAWQAACVLCGPLSAARYNLRSVVLKRRRTIAAMHRPFAAPEQLLATSQEAFTAAPGAAGDFRWLHSSSISGRRVPMHLWVLYREWVDRTVAGQVESTEAWHSFAASRALGLPLAEAEGLKPGEVADILALLAQDGRLGCGSPVDALQQWLDESCQVFDFRFRRAKGRCFQGLSEAEEGEWQGAYSFVQLADPQLGMLHADESWEEELMMLRLAVQHINRLRPRFVVVSGDLSNAWPVGPQANPEAAAKQVKSVKEALREIDPAIPIVLVPGNHDIGQVPGPKELELYTSRWGDDYFSFWVGGVYYMVLNSQFYMDSSLTMAEREAQDRWLAAEFAVVKRRRPKQAIVLSHVPPFVGDPAEPQGWANWELEPRQRLLQLAASAGVRLWLCGHYHGNAVASHRGFEVVTSCSCGCIINWIAKPEVVATSTRPDFFSCVGHPPLISDARHSGMRLVQVTEQGCRHEWFVLADVPASLDDAFANGTRVDMQSRKLSVERALGLDETAEREAAA